MKRRKLRQTFPHQYEVVDCIDGFDPQDTNIVSFFDHEQVVARLSACQDDVSDVLLMTEMLKRHDVFDPVTCWQNAHVVDKFAALVLSGRVVLRKPKPEPRLATVRPAESEPAEPDAQKVEEAKKENAWIEIQVIDQEENPLRGVRYQLVFPDGSSIRRMTNKDAFIRYDRIESGTCDFSLSLKDAWEETENDFLEMVLVDDNDDPMVGKTIHVVLPSGRTELGSTNADGLVRFEYFDPGPCRFDLVDYRGVWEPL